MRRLRQALRAVHGDRGWWHKAALGGLLLLSVVGYPLADGFLMQSTENSKRGYPTPLPPWNDWGVRYIIGLLGLLIELTFFVLPALLTGVLLFCIGAAIALTAAPPLASTLLLAVALLLGCYLLAAFALSLAPIARLLYADEGSIEDALGALPLREATAPASRWAYARARLASLPVYLPPLLLAATTLLVARSATPLAGLLTLLLAWLAASALFYARLVTMQLYIDAEQSLRRAGIPRARQRRGEPAVGR